MEGTETELIPWIGKTAKCMGIIMFQRFMENGLDLTRNQWLLLKKLYARDGQMQKELAFITGRDKTSLGRLVTTMERKGFIDRIPLENDKRTKQIFLTEKGKATYLQSVPVFGNLVQELQEGIGAEKLREVITVLEKIQDNISKMENSKPVLLKENAV